MNSFEKLAFRAARLIRDELLRLAGREPCVGLPEPAWSRCQRLVRQIRRAEQRGWPGAAGRLRQQLATESEQLESGVGCFRRLLTPFPEPVRIAGLRSLYEDIRALEREFEKVRIEPKEKLLAVTTGPIELDGVWLGPFEIRLDWSRLEDEEDAFDTVAIEPQPSPSSNVTHPHVLHDRLCVGDGRQPIRSALRSGRLFDFFQVVAQILATYNSGGAYAQLSEWRGLPCSGCGEHIPEDDHSSCARCNGSYCYDCLPTCEACLDACCSACLQGCAHCGREVCRACRSPCTECEGEFCEQCLVERQCADCREAAAEEEPAGYGSAAAEPSEAAAGEPRSETSPDPLRLGQAAVSA